MGAHLLYITNLIITWYLVGLIWTIQRLHYPLFAHISQDVFIRYEEMHVLWITPIVAPAMVVELATGALLLRSTSWYLSTSERWLCFALILIIWGSTFFIQTPLHSRLMQEHSLTTIRSLVITNWIRTIAWTARGLVLTLPLLRVFKVQ
jgi:hypothetical protein